MNQTNLKTPPPHLDSPRARNQWRKENQANSTGYIGVGRNTGTQKFHASIKLTGQKHRHLGTYPSLISAAVVYDLWAIWMFGTTAITNIIPATKRMHNQLKLEIGRPDQVNATSDPLEDFIVSPEKRLVRVGNKIMPASKAPEPKGLKAILPNMKKRKSK